MSEYNLDSLTCSKELSMLKCMLPFFPPDIQRMLAFYIKWNELQTLLALFRPGGRGAFRAAQTEDGTAEGHSSSYGVFPFRQQQPNPENLIKAFSGYLSEEDKNQMDFLMQTMSAMKMYQEMSETAGSANGSSDSASSGAGAADFLSGMLSPEQKEMFDMYMNMMK